MTNQAISPLRRRMIEGMTIRKLGAKTQHDYVQVKDFAALLGRSPDEANKEDIRRYQLYLASSGVGSPRSTPTSRRCGSSSTLRLIAQTSPNSSHR